VHCIRLLCTLICTHSCEQFLNFYVGFGLCLDFIFVCLFRFTIYVFCVSLDQFIFMLFAFVMFGLVSSVPIYQAKRLAGKNCLRNLFFVTSGK